MLLQVKVSTIVSEMSHKNALTAAVSGPPPSLDAIWETELRKVHVGSLHWVSQSKRLSNFQLNVGI